MVALNFYLSDEMMDRLWKVKDSEGKEELTGNEFARIAERYLCILCLREEKRMT
ncbi:MAG: hypothetical protein ACLUOI_12825 [Eisenbergiella sp.]